MPGRPLRRQRPGLVQTRAGALWGRGQSCRCTAVCCPAPGAGGRRVCVGACAVVPPTCPVTTAATPTRPSPGSPEGSAARRGSPAPAGRHHGRLRPPPPLSRTGCRPPRAASGSLALPGQHGSPLRPITPWGPTRNCSTARPAHGCSKGLASCAARVGGEPWHMTDRGKATGKQCGQFSKCRTD